MTSFTRKQIRSVYTVLFLLLVSLILIRCTSTAPPGGGSSGNDNSGGPSPGNDPPVADPGENQVVSGGASVTLDGSGSSDPDGDTITFSWEQTLGTPVSLSSTSEPVVTCTAPANGTTLRFELTVSDGMSSSAGTVDVSVHPVDESAQVVEVRQRSILEDPAVSGDLEPGWTLARHPQSPPQPPDVSPTQGAYAALSVTQFAPVVEVELSPDATHEVELEFEGASMLLGSARWSGATGPLDVSLSLDGSSVATGSGYAIGASRGGSAVRARTDAGGLAVLSVTNTSEVTVTVRMTLGAIPL